MNTNIITRCLILILSCTTIFLLRSHTFHEPLGAEEAILSVIAQDWIEGGKPYVTLWENEPIGSYIIYRFAINLFGNYELAPKLLATFAIFLATLGLLIILCRYNLQRDTVLLLMILWALFSCLPACHINGSNIEIFILPILMTLYLVLQRYRESGNDFLFWGSILLLTISFLIKQMTLPYFAIPFIIGYQCHWKDRKKLLKRIGIAVLVVSVCHVFSNWLYGYSILDLYLHFKQNILFVTGDIDLSNMKFVKTVLLIPFDKAVSVITYPIIFAYVGTISKSIKNDQSSGLILSYFLLATIFAIALPGSNLPYYYILLIPCVILGLGLFCDSINKKVSLVILVFFVSFYSFFIYKNYLTKHPNEISYTKYNQDNWFVRDRFIGSELLNRKLTGMRAFVDGNHPSVYFYSQNKPAIKYFVDWHYKMMGVTTWKDVFLELQKNPPELCVLFNSMSPNFNTWIEQNYIWQESIEGANVFRLIEN